MFVQCTVFLCRHIIERSIAFTKCWNCPRMNYNDNVSLFLLPGFVCKGKSTYMNPFFSLIMQYLLCYWLPRFMNYNFRTLRIYWHFDAPDDTVQPNVSAAWGGALGVGQPWWPFMEYLALKSELMYRIWVAGFFLAQTDAPAGFILKWADKLTVWWCVWLAGRYSMLHTVGAWIWRTVHQYCLHLCETSDVLMLIM